MVFDNQLATRIRNLFPSDLQVQERKMFGGLAFLIQGHMSCGIVGDRLMIRIAPENYEETLMQPHVLPMDFTGKPMRGFIYVEPAGISTEAALSHWLGRGIAVASSLSPKERRPRRA